MEEDKPPLIVADSVTTLDATSRHSIVVCGSHGGTYAAAVASSLAVRGIIFNDAGVGYRRSGIAGLDLLQRVGIPAAAAGHLSAPIGDGEATLQTGVLAHVNALAREAGCTTGMATREAVKWLVEARVRLLLPLDQNVLAAKEARQLVLERDGVKVWALDSAALVRPEDAGQVVITGSHARLVGGRPESAISADVLAAVFSDAGVRDLDRLPGRLPSLDERGIAAAAVDADTASIGDGRSIYNDGRISACNGAARALGGKVGMTTVDLVDQVISQRQWSRPRSRRVI